MCVELDSAIEVDIDIDALLSYLVLLLVLGRNHLQTLEGELEKTAQKQVRGVARTNLIGTLCDRRLNRKHK